MTVPTHPTVEALRVALTNLKTGMPASVNALCDAAVDLVKEFDDQAEVEFRMALGNGARVPYGSQKQAEKGLATWSQQGGGGRLEHRIVWKTGWVAHE
jgi:hypothetical protein